MTGATGFFGAALVLEIIDASDVGVVCLVRVRERGQDPQGRLVEGLSTAARAYGRPDLTEAIHERCLAVAGDLREPLCGVDPDSVPAVTEAWHSAASINFVPLARQETLRQNVEGTRAVIELARELGAVELNHVSTGYVGTAAGRMYEAPVAGRTDVNNPYEESKALAEDVVRAEDSLRWRIFRPTIIVGHSRTFRALTYFGLYSIVEGALLYRQQLADRVERALGGRPPPAWGDPDAPVNLIPIDVAARNAWAIRSSGHPASFFHLANRIPPTLGEITAAVCDVVGVPLPRFVTEGDELTPLERRLLDRPRSRLFRPYLAGAKEFDLTNADAALGASASTVPMPAAVLRRYVETYVRARESASAVG